VHQARPAKGNIFCLKDPSGMTHIIGIDETHAMAINADQSTEQTDAD